MEFCPVSAQRHYVRHRPGEETLLYRIVEQHTDVFFEHLGERDAILPGFARDEFDAYLRCGRLEHGFLTVKCTQCRYVSRGPIALERLSIDGAGLVVHEFKHPFRDGTTHVLFEPLDFIARLAALVPRPRAHLVRYHGQDLCGRRPCTTSGLVALSSTSDFSAYRVLCRSGSPAGKGSRP